MSHMGGETDLSMIADQLESAIEKILDTTPGLLKAGRNTQVGRLEDAVRLIQKEVEQLRRGQSTTNPGGGTKV